MLSEGYQFDARAVSAAPGESDDSLVTSKSSDAKILDAVLAGYIVELEDESEDVDLELLDDDEILLDELPLPAVDDVEDAPGTFNPYITMMLRPLVSDHH